MTRLWTESRRLDYCAASDGLRKPRLLALSQAFCGFYCVRMEKR